MRAPVYAGSLLGAISLALTGCGGDGGGRVWAGPPEPGADGAVAVDGFAAFQDEVDEPWERSAAMAAAEFLRLDGRTVQRTTIESTAAAEGAGPQTVVVTLDGLFDDSVRAERWTLAFEQTDDAYRLTSARRDLRCQPGRGHDDFSPEPCV
ncbi:MAG TPA: hypothetical protein VNK94_01670 [Gaiellaceae bacterium]|nr:hypothetical protein [Gaiellaceae bacterium]